MNQKDQMNQKKRLDTSPEVPSPGSMEPSCRLRVMPVVMSVIVSQPFDAKTDQCDETSAEQAAGCRQRQWH
jgi:hypothetical protein